MNQTAPNIVMVSLELYIREHVKILWSLRVSVIALKETLAEKVDGFEKSYKKHYEDAERNPENRPSAVALGRLATDFWQLTQLLEELSAQKGK